ncbi:hypothetical protein LSCM1_06761 [Leishmania martiniquensis]|uniref:200 kDa antigen p200 n=1 Tax=Leishmania martiniquensis TaxID=1580590 RepID=A0A836HGZ2_9TRYP|nr:hypothetical protein LSCM1_06761 [Leishmania martiniquensis]
MSASERPPPSAAISSLGDAPDASAARVAQQPGASAPPPEATVPSLRITSVADAAVAPADDDKGSAANNRDGCSLYSVGGELHSWTGRQEDEEALPLAGDAFTLQKGSASTLAAARSPPAQQRASLLFDTAVATEALLARVQQQQPSAEPPPPHPCPVGSDTQSRRTQGPIYSILGRPPPAPQVSATTAAAPPCGPYPYAYPTPQRDSSAPSSAAMPTAALGGLRSVSPTSTVDFIEIEHKQKELRDAVEHHVQSLERSLALRDEEVATLSSRLRKLEEDYQFNYNLIAERDAALEEASGQLQRLYRELKRLTEESTRMEKRIDTAEKDAKAARQRVREVEEERDSAVRQVQRDFAIKERHLTEALRAKEEALEEEQAEQHAWYKERAKALEEERAVMADRSALVSMEAEDRFKQQIARLQTEVSGLQQALKDARQQKADADRRIAAAEEANSALAHESTMSQQRHEAFVQEAALAKKELEERLVRVVGDAEKRVLAAEATAREEAGRASRTELERTRLQSMLAEAQERLQHLTTRYDEDVARFTKERQQLLKSSDEAMAATATVEQELHDTKRELEQQRRLASEESTRLRREVERAQEASEVAHKELVAANEKCSNWRVEAQRLESEVHRWKAEEGKTATSGRQECSAWEEKYRQAELQAQLLQEEVQQTKKTQQAAVEQAQAEVIRLTRELHASEASRRALDDRLHLQKDFREERDELQMLRMEREQLQKRVAELEHTNAEVRLQVANFAAELQNDPVIKAAKETQQRAVALQQELAHARAEAQLLQDSLRTKEEELGRLQTEMLRVQVLVANDGTESPPVDAHTHLAIGAATLSDHVSRALHRQQQQMRSEYSRMRESYEEMVRELDRQRRRRRRSARRSRTASATSSSSAGSLSAQDAKEPKHHHKQGDVERPAAPAASVPPQLPDSKTAHLLQESEVWRQRCMQLEQQLLAVLRERDRLQKELQLAKQDVVALGAEKASLVDLNSLLKAQLREAYRLRLGDGSACLGRGPEMTAPAASAHDVRISPQLLAAALQALEEGTPVGDDTAERPRKRSAAGAAVTATRPRSRTDEASALNESPVVHSTRGYVGPHSSSAALQSSSAQQAQDRLTALEHEIEAVRKHLSTASSVPLPPQRQHGQAVIRRGNAGVRHYGLSD